MTDLLITPTNRRAFLSGVGVASGGLMLSGCATGLGGFSLTEAVRRILLLSSENAFARLTATGGYWDQQVSTLGVSNFLGGGGGGVGGGLASILTSALFKSRLEREFAGFAVGASERAAPLVADAVRTAGIAGAAALVQGGPTAATGFLRGELGNTLIDAMVPQLGQAMRVAQEPLVAQAISAVSGVDVAGVATRVGNTVNNAIWTEIGREESAIRADPRSTNDPLLIGVFGVAGQVL